MTFSEFCTQYKLDKKKLEPMVVKVMKNHFPGLSSLSDHSVMQYTDILTLPDSFYIELSKYLKLWAFS